MVFNGGFWWFLLVLHYSWWFLKGFGFGFWCFLLVFVGSRWLYMVLGGCSWIFWNLEGYCWFSMAQWVWRFCVSLEGVWLGFIVVYVCWWFLLVLNGSLLVCRFLLVLDSTFWLYMTVYSCWCFLLIFLMVLNVEEVRLSDGRAEKVSWVGEFEEVKLKGLKWGKIAGLRRDRMEELQVGWVETELQQAAPGESTIVFCSCIFSCEFSDL